MRGPSPSQAHQILMDGCVRLASICIGGTRETTSDVIDDIINRLGSLKRHRPGTNEEESE